MLQCARFTVFTISESLRENQQGRGDIVLDLQRVRNPMLNIVAVKMMTQESPICTTEFP